MAAMLLDVSLLSPFTEKGTFRTLYNEQAFQEFLRIYFTLAAGDVVHSPAGGRLAFLLGKPISQALAERVKTRIIEELKGLRPKIVVNSLSVVGDFDERMWYIQGQFSCEAYSVETNFGLQIQV